MIQDDYKKGLAVINEMMGIHFEAHPRNRTITFALARRILSVWLYQCGHKSKEISMLLRRDASSIRAIRITHRATITADDDYSKAYKIAYRDFIKSTISGENCFTMTPTELTKALYSHTTYKRNYKNKRAKHAAQDTSL